MTKNYTNLNGVFLKLLCLLAIGLMSIAHAEAKDDLTVSGQVIDQNGSAIIGASIKIKSTHTGTSTNVNGQFNIVVPVGGTIEVAYLGYIPQNIVIKDASPIKVVLKEDVISLNDVVVVGYGTQKKESLTGAISNLKADEISKTKAPSLAQAIQGKVAGLRIRQENGEPGRFSTNINIRGLGTPLFIIDGVVRDNGVEFQKLNPEDIESISFLKDATAAIYGMNSANGAIIVTTKKGRLGAPRINITTNFGFSTPTDVPQMANAAQYMTMRNEAELNAGRPAYITKDELTKWQQGAPGYESTDLYDAVFNAVAPQNQTTISLEGGTEKIRYYGSLGYASENSLIKNNALTFDKFTLQSNVSMDITKNLTATLNIRGRHDKNQRPWFNFFDIFKSTRVNPPTTPIYANDNPEYYNNYGYVTNPYVMIDKDYSGGIDEINKNMQTLFSLEYNLPFIDGLKVKATGAYDYNSYRHKGIRKGYKTYTYGEYTGEYSPSSANFPSLIQDNRHESERIDIQLQANYNKTFGLNNIKATYVFERREENAAWLNGERQYDFFTIGEMDNASESEQKVSGSSTQQAYLSHIGRVAYDYAGKYLAEVAFRYDGSYRYAPNRRWAFFPSASVGWRVSEESFIKDNLKFIDNLKLRFSIGRSGQDAGDPFQYIPGYTLNNGGAVFTQDKFTNGVASPVMVNTNLTWIKVDMYNVGMDYSMLNGLFGFEFDVYQRRRSGLLADRYGSLPNTFGSKLPQENLNGDLTRGIEFTLSHNNKVGDFRYRVSGNFNFARTKKEYVERGPFTSSMDRWRNQKSDRWGDFVWGYEIDGRFQNFDQINTYPIQHGDTGNSKELPGDYIIRDVNGDGIVNDLDKTPLFWSGSPLLHFGLNFDASWKNFDFYMLIQGSAFYTIQFDEVYAKMLCFKGGNTPEYFYDRWHLADPYNPNSEWISGKWPAIRLEQDMGSFYTRDSKIWRKDASYARLKTIELGYTFNLKLLKKLNVSNLRIYVNANNLFTICDPFIKPFDPERIEGDFSAGLNYPLNKIYNCGVSLNF